MVLAYFPGLKMSLSKSITYASNDLSSTIKGELENIANIKFIDKLE
jgi:hypothetical protein